MFSGTFGAKVITSQILYHMEDQKQFKDIPYHAEMLAAMVRNESHMKAIISLLIDIRSKLTDESVPVIEEVIGKQIGAWQKELTEQMTEL